MLTSEYATKLIINIVCAITYEQTKNMKGMERPVYAIPFPCGTDTSRKFQ